MSARFLLSLRTVATALLFLGCSAPPSFAAPCVSFTEAEKHIGATRCITGTVLHVMKGNGGVHFFDFCENYRVCPFTVVVFPRDLKQIGDVRGLEGRQIEIEGEVKSYDGRAEIILRRLSQLRGDAARIPPLPKEYDVERHGKYSAGRFNYPKSSKNTSRKRQSRPIPLDDPSSPTPPTE
jgi:hypothetical protein